MDTFSTILTIIALLASLALWAALYIAVRLLNQGLEKVKTQLQEVKA